MLRSELVASCPLDAGLTGHSRYVGTDSEDAWLQDYIACERIALTLHVPNGTAVAIDSSIRRSQHGHNRYDTGRNRLKQTPSDQEGEQGDLLAP